ncbi:hypothetical protein PAPYR_7644 [Paratrimastix pyriformis]|uniref:CUE domain-containing protein n=1 Tax=Paratrimastix pyriformis TaxID=342808 RepID=A0ABQ8UCK1_9EUKA|nr:hypothetical protein PAPYR_7644 [Paratrimastix pyriformis]
MDDSVLWRALTLFDGNLEQATDYLLTAGDDQEPPELPQFPLPPANSPAKPKQSLPSDPKSPNPQPPAGAAPEHLRPTPHFPNFEGPEGVLRVLEMMQEGLPGRPHTPPSGQSPCSLTAELPFTPVLTPADAAKLELLRAKHPEVPLATLERMFIQNAEMRDVVDLLAGGPSSGQDDEYYDDPLGNPRPPPASPQDVDPDDVEEIRPPQPQRPAAVPAKSAQQPVPPARPAPVAALPSGPLVSPPHCRLARKMRLAFEQQRDAHSLTIVTVPNKHPVPAATEGPLAEPAQIPVVLESAAPADPPPAPAQPAKPDPNHAPPKKPVPAAPHDAPPEAANEDDDAGSAVELLPIDHPGSPAPPDSSEAPPDALQLPKPFAAAPHRDAPVPPPPRPDASVEPAGHPYFASAHFGELLDYEQRTIRMLSESFPAMDPAVLEEILDGVAWDLERAVNTLSDQVEGDDDDDDDGDDDDAGDDDDDDDDDDKNKNKNQKKKTDPTAPEAADDMSTSSDGPALQPGRPHVTAAEHNGPVGAIPGSSRDILDDDNGDDDDEEEEEEEEEEDGEEEEEEEEEEDESTDTDKRTPAKAATSSAAPPAKSSHHHDAGTQPKEGHTSAAHPAAAPPAAGAPLRTKRGPTSPIPAHGRPASPPRAPAVSPPPTAKPAPAAGSNPFLRRDVFPSSGENPFRAAAPGGALPGPAEFPQGNPFSPARPAQQPATPAPAPLNPAAPAPGALLDAVTDQPPTPNPVPGGCPGSAVLASSPLAPPGAARALFVDMAPAQDPEGDDDDGIPKRHAPAPAEQQDSSAQVVRFPAGGTADGVCQQSVEQYRQDATKLAAFLKHKQPLPPGLADPPAGEEEHQPEEQNNKADDGEGSNA